MAIRSFSNEPTREFFLTGRVRPGAGWHTVARIARRKLDMIHYASELWDLRSPPGNRLERLKGGRRGFHSIRVNERWRIVFRWTRAGAEEVRIEDYH